MVGTSHGQPDIAHRQPGLGNVAPHEIGIVVGKSRPLQPFLGVEQAGASVEQQARGLMQGNAGRVAMMVAAAEQGFVSDQPAMPHHQVIEEHAGAAATKLGERQDFELHLDACHCRELFSQLVQRLLVTAVIEQGAAANEDEELKVVVRGVPLRRAQHSAFTTAVATGEHEPFDLVVGHQRPDPVAHLQAHLVQVLLQFVTAIQGESSAHAAR